MRDVPEIWEAWRSGSYVGERRPATRVTVQKGWSLTTTDTTLGTWNRGPARWYQEAVERWEKETEVPNVVSVNIQRSIESDSGSCDIVIQNTLMPELGAPEVPPGQFGDIGALTPDHGLAQDAQARWGHTRNTWSDVLAPNALLRTYQGFGGHDKTIDQAVTDGNLVLNGVWLVDDVTITTDGSLSLKCRDMAKLLLDQQLFPPLVPEALYPLSYKRWDLRSATIPADEPPAGGVCFDSSYGFWDSMIAQLPSATSGWHSSSDQYYGAYNSAATGHPPAEAFDISYEPNVGPVPGAYAHQASYWLSEPKGSPNDWVWIEFSIQQGVSATINQIYFHPWAGNYFVQVSVFENGEWVAPQTNDGGTTVHGLPYVGTFVTNWEGGQPPGADTNQRPLPRDYRASRVRLTITNLVRAPEGGYRAGARKIMACFSDTIAVYPSLVFAGASLPVSGAVPPRLGYWQVRNNGRVYAFGDARLYDANSPAGAPAGDVVAMAAHPSGDGYWLLDSTGRVLSHGLALHYGDLASLGRTDVIDLAPAADGAGYYLLTKQGGVYAYGSAQYYGNSSHSGSLPTGVAATARSIESHPSSQGYWVLWSDGAVTAHNLPDYGSGTRGGEFTTEEWFTHLRRNSTGTGYWILSGGGSVQPRGSVGDFGSIDRGVISSGEWYKSLTWDLLPSSENDDGYGIQQANGLLNARGDVTAFQYGDVGSGNQIQRYPGNYLDYADIVRELCLWSGFYLRQEPQPAAEFPDVYGNIENTGAWADDPLPQEMFDKRPVIDAIKALRDIVGYAFWVDPEGGVRFESPNWWTMGNFLIDGTPLGDMPEIDETVQLTNLSGTRSAQSARSELIIANSNPLPAKAGETPPTDVLVTRIVPRTKTDLRGLVVPAMWVHQAFLNPYEQKVMAELIDLRSWFARRTTSTTCVANPLIDINDQVRIVERQTGEVFIHYVRGVSFSHDLRSGEFSMQLTTHWLGGSPYGVNTLFWAGDTRPQGDGYWTATFGGYTSDWGEAESGVYAYGNAPLLDRNEADSHLTTIVALRTTASGEGYYTLDRKGKVLTYGDAVNLGEALRSTDTAADLALTPSGNGYWILDYDGTVHSFGDAVHYGNATLPPGTGYFLGTTVHAEAIESHGSTMGYWVLLSDGQVQAFNLTDYGNADRDGLRPEEWFTTARRTAESDGLFVVSAGGHVKALGNAVWQGDSDYYPDDRWVSGLIWTIFVNPSNGYALMHNDGNIDTYNFTLQHTTTAPSDLYLNWAIATEASAATLVDPTAAFVISTDLMQFLKGTASLSANNASANGFGAPQEPTLKTLTL